MLIIILLSVLLLVMGVVIFIGKGDNLIAGYNTSSQEERAKYHVKRLRLLIGGHLIILVPLMVLMLRSPSTGSVMAFVAVTFVLCTITVILANTWAKKK